MSTNLHARYATLDQLLQTVIANLRVARSKDMLREWFDGAGVRRYMANPAAKRGGGPVHYVVADVEKLTATRTGFKRRSLDGARAAKSKS